MKVEEWARCEASRGPLAIGTLLKEGDEDYDSSKEIKTECDDSGDGTPVEPDSDSPPQPRLTRMDVPMDVDQAIVPTSIIMASPTVLNRPSTFAPNWLTLKLLLPLNLRIRSLPSDFIEVLKKVRSMPCSHCAAGKCTQEPTGRRTWKCKGCSWGGRSYCDWMNACEQYGLFKMPPILLKHEQIPPVTPPRAAGTPSGGRRSRRIADRTASMSPNQPRSPTIPLTMHVQTQSLTPALSTSVLHSATRSPAALSASQNDSCPLTMPSAMRNESCPPAELHSSSVGSMTHEEASQPAAAPPTIRRESSSPVAPSGTHIVTPHSEASLPAPQIAANNESQHLSSGHALAPLAASSSSSSLPPPAWESAISDLRQQVDLARAESREHYNVVMDTLRQLTEIVRSGQPQQYGGHLGSQTSGKGKERAGE